jgi:hypothetical protein
MLTPYCQRDYCLNNDHSKLTRPMDRYDVELAIPIRFSIFAALAGARH